MAMLGAMSHYERAPLAVCICWVHKRISQGGNHQYTGNENTQTDSEIDKQGND